MMEQAELASGFQAMRIMLLVTGLKLGGAEQQVAALARQFAALGHAVAVVSLTPDCQVDLHEGIETLRLDMRKTPLSMANALWRVRRFVQEWHPDVIHAHMVHANLFARVLTRICATPATICTAHSYREGGKLRMLAYRLTDGWTDLTTHVSSEGRQRMIEAGAVAEDRIIVVSNGIDTSRFQPNDEFRARTRTALGIGAEDRLVVNVGRLVPEKAQTVLLDAFSLAWAESGAMLMLAGDGPERAALEQRIARLGLTGRAILLGRRQDIPELLNAADLFVLSSEIEGMPLVIGEALACGCPVVATDAAGVAELLMHPRSPTTPTLRRPRKGGEPVTLEASDDPPTQERTPSIGTVVPRGNPQALAQAIGEALAQGRGDAAAQAARHQRIARHLSLEAVAAQWLRHYARLARTAAVARMETA